MKPLSFFRPGYTAAALAVIIAAISATVQGDSVPASRGALPFEPLAYETLNKAKRKVFAHYFTQFPISLDNKPPEQDYYTRQYLNPYGENSKFLSVGGFLRNRPLPRPVNPSLNWKLQDMRKEVRLAKGIGLDGFTVNILNYEGYHYERTVQLLQAAEIEGDGFEIVLMPDMNAALRHNPGQFVQLIVNLAKYPAAMRLDDGRLVVAPYMAHRQTPQWWASQLAELKRRGINVAFVPLFHNWQAYYKQYAHLSYGVTDWGHRAASSAANWGNMAAKAHSAGLIWMAPVAPQDVRPKNSVYWEASNSEMFRKQWEASINGGSDWVQLITWNDFSEHSSVTPSTSTNYAYHDLTAYYTTWFKTGRRPPITRDAFYTFHRTHATGASPDPRLQSKKMVPSSSSDAPQNQVEMVAFLTASATLEIELAGKLHSRYAEKGVTSFKVPLQAGKPLFRIVRNGKVVTSMYGEEIKNNISVQDMLYHGDSSLRVNGPTPTVPAPQEPGTQPPQQQPAPQQPKPQQPPQAPQQPQQPIPTCPITID